MGYGPPTKTVADVMRAVKRQFGDESGVQLEDTDIADWINKAQLRINEENKVLKAKSTVPSVAGQAAYSFAALNIQSLEALHYDGMRIPNMTFAQAEETVSQADPTGLVSDVQPRLWYEWGGSFTFWPYPTDVKNIDVYYTVKPTVVTTTPTDLLSLPDDYFEAVVNYVLQQAYEMDEDWQASQLKEQQFSEGLLRRGEADRTAQNMTFETITVVNDYYN